MRIQHERKPPQKMVGFKVSAEFRGLIERLAATLTLRRNERITLTDVMIEGLEMLAKKEKVQ